MRFMPTIYLLLVAFSMVGLTSCGSPDSDMNRQDQISRLLEGTYELSSWNDGDQQYTSPAVRGRITFYDGTIVFILHNNINPDKVATLAWMGEYRMKGDTFGYRYTNSATFKTQDGVTTQSNDVPWSEFREYTVEELTDSMLVLHANGGKQVLEMNLGQLIYTDFNPSNNVGSGSGFANRVWNRISDKP